MRRRAAFAAVAMWGGTLALQAAVLDRVAVTVGKDVILESEVIQEIRLTDFLNQAPVDLGAAAKQAAADRLVDQDLIRGEMQLENFAAPPPAGADQTLGEFKQARFRSPEGYSASLKMYGITEEELKQHISWQVAALRFTEQRFRPGTPPPAASAAPTVAKHARVPVEEAPAHEAARQIQPAETPAATTVDEQLDTWLKQTRAQTKIQFHKEALE